MIGVVEWGTVPQWLGLLSILVAVAVFGAGRLDSARAQASGVYLMVTSFHYGVGTEREKDHTHVEIHNDTDLPIYDVSIAAWQWGARRVLWRLRKSAEWLTGDRLDGRLWVSLRPRSSVATEDLTPVNGYPVGYPKARGKSINPPVTLAFRDANGRRWVRWEDGRLSRRWPSRA